MSFETITDAESSQRLEDALMQIGEVSTLPHVAIKIMEITNDPEAGAMDLTRAVGTDPSLSVRILRAVNAASSGARSEITTLHQAISFLGFNKVRNLALTASVSRIFAEDHTIGTYQRTNLWRHLLAVGLCARMVALRWKIPSFEDAFLAGLLHDIGLIVLDQNLHKPFSEVMNQAVQDERELIAQEMSVFGFDHTMIGQALATQWKFPEHLVAAIRYHHDSMSAPEQHLSLVQCVEVANYVCTIKEISSIGVNRVKPPVGVFRSLSMNKDDLIVISEDLDEEIVNNQSLFEM